MKYKKIHARKNCAKKKINAHRVALKTIHVLTFQFPREKIHARDFAENYSFLYEKRQKKFEIWKLEF